MKFSLNKINKWFITVLVALCILTIASMVLFKPNNQGRLSKLYEMNPNCSSLLRNMSKLSNQRISSCKNNKIAVKNTSIAVFTVHDVKSSILANILYRYGVYRHLSFVIPWFSGKNKFWPDSLSNTWLSLTESCNENYQVLNVDARFNGREKLSQLMDKNTFILTSIHDPAGKLKSDYFYYGYDKTLALKGYSFNDFLIDPLYYIKRYLEIVFGKNIVTSILWNPMSTDLGLTTYNIPIGVTLKDIRSNKELESEVENFLNTIEREINFTVILENFDQSLVLLMRKMNWCYEDIAYIKQNAGNNFNDNAHISNEEGELTLNWNYIDFQLYKRMLAKFEKEIKNMDEDFSLQVEEFRELNQLANLYCLTKQSEDNSYVNGAVHTSDYVLTEQGETNLCCIDMSLDETSYVKRIRKYIKNKCNYPSD